MIHAAKNKDRRNWRKLGGKNYNIGAVVSLVIIGLVWFFAAHAVGSPFIFPYLEDVLYQVVYSLTDVYVLTNLGITMRRVITGSTYAFIIGFPIGMIMGYSPKLLQWMSPFINSLRQVPGSVT